HIPSEDTQEKSDVHEVIGNHTIRDQIAPSGGLENLPPDEKSSHTPAAQQDASSDKLPEIINTSIRPTAP
ncbi:MAG: hypothetical protein LBL45_09170, partial [Treponema sp.]|nr:hypothetical protein [Treponema sp.]